MKPDLARTHNLPSPGQRMHSNTLSNHVTRSLLIPMLALLLASSGAQANDSVKFTGSGFLTIAAGDILSGNNYPADNSGYNCPCFISDYGNGGVYEGKGLDWKPDSKLGLQGRVDFFKINLAFTGQAVFRGAVNGHPDLEWLYGEYRFNDEFNLQVGRKRLPLFYYSESQDVGFSYPWVHLPPQLYGWEIVNYDGANLNYKTQTGSWSHAFEVFAGDETRHDSGYWKVYDGKYTKTNAKWSNILGADYVASRDWFEGRLLYIQAFTQNDQTNGDGATNVYTPPEKLHIYGTSININYHDWVIEGELLYINRKHDYGMDHAQLVALGYHFGDWMPMLSYSNYKQQLNSDDHIDIVESHATVAALVRYDLSASSDIKIEFDDWRDHTAPGYPSVHGNTRLLTASYDKVF